MFCTKCGREIPDDANVCPFCGQLVIDEQEPDFSDKIIYETKAETDSNGDDQKSEEVPSDLSEKIISETQADINPDGTAQGNAQEQQFSNGQSSYGQGQQFSNGQPDGAAFDPITGEPINNGPSFDPMTGQLVVSGSVPPKRRTPRIVATAIIAAAAVAVCVVGGGFLRTRSLLKNSVVIMSKDYLSLLTGIQKSDPSEKRISRDFYYSARFSPSGKYLYFGTETRNSDSYDLNRIKVSDISENSSKTESKIDEVARDVSTYELISDNSLVYCNDDNELYYLNGDDKYSIDEDVSYVAKIDSGRILYSRYDEDKDETTLCTAKLGKSPSPKDIDEITSIVQYNDNGVIYTTGYDYDSDSDTHSLVKADMSGNTDTIANDVEAEYYDYKNDDVWYTTSDSTEMTLSDLVSDKYASEDKSVNTVNKEDYLEPLDNYYDDYIPDYFYDSDYDDDGYAYYNDEDTYVNSLPDMAYNKNKDKFYSFDSYNYLKDLVAYYEADERDQVRSAAKSTKVKVPEYNLYYYDGKNSTQVSDKVSSVNSTSGKLAIVTKADDSSSYDTGVDISDYVDNLQEYDPFDYDYYDDYDGYCYYYEYCNYKYQNFDSNDSVSQLSDAVDENIDDSSSGSSKQYYSVSGGALSSLPSDKNVSNVFVDEAGKNATFSYYNDDYASELISYKISGSSLTDEKRISKSGYILSSIDNKTYFMDDVSDDWSGKFSYWDGKGIVVVSDRDVNVTNFGKLSGGYVLVGSDGELNIVNDGDVNRIEKSNVSNVYVSKSGQVLYLYDGDLYRVKKGDTNSERIARDVDDFRLYKGKKIY